MKILGIDPGLATVGIGIVEAENAHSMKAIDWCTIRTKAGLCMSDRLIEIANDLEEVIKEYKPDHAVIEQLFFATNAKTALDVAQARGVIVHTVAKHGIALTEATPLQLKSAIAGSGSAQKHQVQSMLVHILKLKETPTPDDAADALGLAVYGALQLHSAMQV